MFWVLRCLLNHLASLRQQSRLCQNDLRQIFRVSNALTCALMEVLPGIQANDSCLTTNYIGVKSLCTAKVLIGSFAILLLRLSIRMHRKLSIRGNDGTPDLT